MAAFEPWVSVIPKVHLYPCASSALDSEAIKLTSLLKLVQESGKHGVEEKQELNQHVMEISFPTLVPPNNWCSEPSFCKTTIRLDVIVLTCCFFTWPGRWNKGSQHGEFGWRSSKSLGMERMTPASWSVGNIQLSLREKTAGSNEQIS